MAKKIIAFIVHAAPYGSERCLSALRVAAALAARPDAPDVRLFLMSDATVLGLPNQHDNGGKGLQAYVETLVQAGASVCLCSTCVQARGLADLALIDGVRVSGLAELGDWILAADQVITF